MRWLIYYGDGSTYYGDPYQAPAVNVQVIANEADNESGFTLNHSKDFYIWIDRWYAADQAGMYDYLMFHHGPKMVLFGRTIRDADYWKILGKAGREGLDG